MPIKYRNDHAMVLFLHGLEWSLLMMLPIIIYDGWNASGILFAVMIGNALIHAYIDDLKCNRMRITLTEDQMMHLVQVAVTFMIFAEGLI